jgi:uncharacterized protein YqhQ
VAAGDRQQRWFRQPLPFDAIHVIARIKGESGLRAEEIRSQHMREDQIIIGGQAVMEGVMMRAPHSYAVAVRRQNGEIVTKSERLPVLSEKYPVLKQPIVRGAAVLIQSLVLGIKSLNFSASVAIEEVEKKTDDTSVETTQAVGKGDDAKSRNSAVAGSIVFALLINVVLFILLPLLLTNILFVYLGGGTLGAHSESGRWYAEAWVWLKAALTPVRPSIAFNLVDGLIRMSFFIAMIAGFSLLKDLRRVFEYHGAEHKVVYTWEAQEPLTVENARVKRRQHPRCGTSFLMIVMLVAIVAFSIVKFDSLALNFLTRIVLIPVIAGVSYEIIRASAQSRTQMFLSVITRPGLWLQNITTKEPSDEQLYVAIVALEESLKLEPAREPEAAAA